MGGGVFINCKTDVELLVGSSVRVISVGQLVSIALFKTSPPSFVRFRPSLCAP